MGQTAWESLRVPAVKLGSISTSPQEECPGSRGYSRVRLWAKASPGSPHGPPSPAGYSQRSQANPWGMVVRWVSQRTDVRPQRCVCSQRPEEGLHGLRSAEGARSEEGWPRGSGQVLAGAPGRAHPYLPGSAEGSQWAAVVGPMAARPGLRWSPRGLPSEWEESLPQALESVAGLCFL